MKQDNWKKRKQQILKQLNKCMDFLLIGSVVTYHHKCCKTCRCNKGKGHLGHYLSANINGKTKNLYLNKEVVDQARLMAQSYSEVKQLLKELSEVNYQILREKNPGARRRQASRRSRVEMLSSPVIKSDGSSDDHQTLG
jgi:hypothetical protein